MSRFAVEFRIYGRALDPGAMTELLALKPCQVVMPGTRRGSRIVEEAMWAFNGSEDGVADSPEWSTLEEGLKSVLEKLWSRRDLIAQYNGASRKIWWCGQFHAGWNSGTALPASLLTELAEFSADLFIDTYVSETGTERDTATRSHCPRPARAAARALSDLRGSLAGRRGRPFSRTPRRSGAWFRCGRVWTGYTS